MSPLLLARDQPHKLSTDESQTRLSDQLLVHPDTQSDQAQVGTKYTLPLNTRNACLIGE